MGVFIFTVGNARQDALAADANHPQAFYVSNAGNDSWDGGAPEHRGGTSGPWKSLAKVSEHMTVLKGGRVLFRRGDQFAGRLQVRGWDLTFAAYGEGARPVVTGARALPAEWKPVAGRPNVNVCELPQDIAEVTVLLREGTSLPLAFDGGAIYTYGDKSGSVVEENIILCGMANDSGLVGEKFFSTGIQCDAKTANLVIRNNTIAYPNATAPVGAIHLNFNGHDNTISGNTILTRSTGISTLDRDPHDRAAGGPSPPSMSGNRFEDNVIVRLTGSPPNSPARWAAIVLQDRQQCERT